MALYQFFLMIFFSFLEEVEVELSYWESAKALLSHYRAFKFLKPRNWDYHWTASQTLEQVFFYRSKNVREASETIEPSRFHMQLAYVGSVCKNERLQQIDGIRLTVIIA